MSAGQRAFVGFYLDFWLWWLLPWGLRRSFQHSALPMATPQSCFTRRHWCFQSGGLLAGWGIFIRLNCYAEALEPEAMQAAKSEDDKLKPMLSSSMKGAPIVRKRLLCAAAMGTRCCVLTDKFQEWPQNVCRRQRRSAW